MVTYHFYCFLFFETVLDRGHSGTVSKNSSQLLFLRNHLSSPSEPAILNKSTMCLGLKSSPRLKYKLSKVDYSPTPWGLVIHRSACKPPRMPHVSPGWGGGGGFHWQVHKLALHRFAQLSENPVENVCWWSLVAKRQQIFQDAVSSNNFFRFGKH